MSEQGTAPPPGFYDDGSGRQRWWDGEQWTEHHQAGASSAEPEEQGKDLISGTAIIGYLLALLMPFIGFFVGLALIARSDRHGIGVLLLSVVVFFVYIAVVF